MNYDTGYQYVVTGTNIQHDGNTISAPNTDQNSNTINGVTSTWTGLDHTQKPNFTLVTPGEPFQFTESYSGPGLSNHTIIQENHHYTKDVTNTTSTFSKLDINCVLTVGTATHHSLQTSGCFSDSKSSCE